MRAWLIEFRGFPHSILVVSCDAHDAVEVRKRFRQAASVKPIGLTEAAGLVAESNTAEALSAVLDFWREGSCDLCGCPLGERKEGT